MQVIRAIETRVGSIGVEFKKKGHGTNAILAFGIGIAFGTGLILTLLTEYWRAYGTFLMFLAFFHWSEYILVALYRTEVLSANSFLINHSVPYTIAIVSCQIEFLVELYFYPGLKTIWYIYYFGILVTLIGTCFRVLAQAHAKHNFTHNIVQEKKETHQLVTTGVYKLVRHPGYFGWFWYTIGMQIILANPICFVGFTITSWVFFHKRIAFEEIFLHDFFGEDYVNYKEKTHTLIPLIR